MYIQMIGSINIYVRVYANLKVCMCLRTSVLSSTHLILLAIVEVLCVEKPFTLKHIIFIWLTGKCIDLCTYVH